MQNGNEKLAVLDSRFDEYIDANETRDKSINRYSLSLQLFQMDFVTKKIADASEEEGDEDHDPTQTTFGSPHRMEI
jgi:hypothetical protein